MPGRPSSSELEGGRRKVGPARAGVDGPIEGALLRSSKYLVSAFLIAFSAKAQTGIDPSRTKSFEARATIATGQVTRLRDDQPWAISSGDLIPIQQTLSTGQDGYVQLQLAGGTTFEILGNSKVHFRQNLGNPNDVLDLVSGRVRMQLRPKRGDQQRVFSPSAIITTHLPTSLAMAMDEDDNVRIDVIEGEIRVQHAKLPGSQAVLVRAIDSILVERDEAISRKVDRGTLYRYRAKILTAVTFGHIGHDADPVEGNKFLGRSRVSRPLRLSF